MNPTPPPVPKQGHGCLIFLAVLVALVIVAALVVYHVVARTAFPYRFLASKIEKANPNLKISGITGSLNSGLGIEAITWGDDPQNRSEILDLQIKYTFSGDPGGKARVVVHEVGVRKVHFDLADFGPGTDSTTTTTSPMATGGSSQALLSGLEIERVSIEDVLITDHATNLRLSIPKIEWTGFKWTPTSFEPGTLVVESDRLTLHTSAGRTIPVDGLDVTFQKNLTGTVLPALHPAIKQPIPFVADASYRAQGQVRASHGVVAEGKLEWNTTDDGGGSLHVRQLDLPSFIDARKLFGEQAADLPGDLVMSAVATSGFTDGHGTMNITGGSFRLGVATFQIEPVEFAAAEQSGTTLQAVCSTDAGKIVWALPLASLGKEFHPRLRSTGMPPEEILARVFAGKPYADLNDQEKKKIDARRAVYFPTPEQ